ncbi:Malonyl-coenzyme A:anthocyanin 3-O-glucoside-6''-O-malonyltransferase [Dichanthelium oligosanthes]|uniref:Malonyl-coenzyme A:anthocyanin 3-O-glucoside-6''-O-malonyltransferase n=1 Tax=Dichanthelium oligosanthes TaxID=888268 RepID=A0A1E5W093_9POAL|nr:Malonyl-coenzyme A:anthocyanin 3-O-glucoside-6''-O-malonyltransferase [Dichanthelium oligosanthes]
MAAAPDQEQLASSASPRFRVLDDTTLVPPSPSPPETSLPLTFFDIIWLNSPPVERLFFYRLAPDADVATIISNLKDSLRQAVRAFYPLAGRLRLSPGTSDRYELYYRPGDGVAFTVAECNDDADIDGLATDEPREVAKIATLVPPLPDGGGLLALQATLLSARRSLAIGVTVHHAACDGSGSTHFLHTWAAACTGVEAPPPPPVIDRTLLTDPRGLYYIFFQGAPRTDEMEFVNMSADQLFATFTLCKEDLRRVKDAVADEATRRGVAPPRCSSLVAAFGFAWSCYQRAKENCSAGESPMTCMIFPVDHRTRMKPPLPDKYLGNCVGPAFAMAPKGELAAAGAGGLFSACSAVASAIDEAVRDIGTSNMDVWDDRVREAMAMGILTVAGSPRFRVYELDFGFGRPEKVDIVSVARTGAVAVAESRGSASGMEVGVSLQPAGMERYRKCFADAIAWLHQRT